MRRYTTPTLRLTVSGADLVGCNAWVTFAQGERSLTLRLDTVADWEVGDGTATGTVTLTQDQTARFAEGRDVEVQVNVVDPNGYRWATDIATCRFGRNLLELRRGHD